MTHEHGDIHRAAHSGGNNRIDPSVIAAMSRRSEAQAAKLRDLTVLSRRLALTGEERRMRSAARSAMLTRLGVDVAALERVRTSRQDRLRGFISTPDVVHRPYSIPTEEDKHDAPDSLDMWWGQTNWWGNAPNVSWSWQDDGAHFSGWVHVDDDDLQKYNLTVLAQFFLGADRIPDSARGLVTSAPAANVFGIVFAVAKDFSLFNAFDDQWAKCWLNTRQNVWVTVPGLNLPIFGDRIPWASNADSRNLIFLDSMGTDQNYFPGRINLPPVQFNLDPRVTSVEIDLEFSFDMQLEGGDSNLVFGTDRDWPSNVVQTSQWKLQR